MNRVLKPPFDKLRLNGYLPLHYLILRLSDS